MGIKLGVNIDHIATLRQARKEVEPDPLAAARVCKTAGADFIVAHLRQDRRHIQDSDLMKLRQGKFHLHVEVANTPAMVAAVSKIRPDAVCIVPESPDEVTTQGGLNLGKAAQGGLKNTIKKLKAKGIEVSLFVDPDAASVRMAKMLDADTVELCTTKYAIAEGNHKQRFELEKLQLAGYLAYEMGMNLHAGHGLDYHNVGAVASIPHMGCLNIGFSIIARSVFTGLKTAVVEMKKLMSSAR